MKHVKIGLKLIAAIVLVYSVLNWQYLYVQVKYYLDPPQVQPSSTETEELEPSGEPDRISIPSLGITAPVVYTDDEDEDSFQKALQNGVVHYPNTAHPGEPGNVYIFGHSSDFPTAPGNYKTVFALLPKIKQGDIIEISDPQGKIHKYAAAETKVISPSDLGVLNQDFSKKQLTLQTSYPIGTAFKRFIVVAFLEE